MNKTFFLLSLLGSFFMQHVVKALDSETAITAAGNQTEGCRLKAVGPETTTTVITASDYCEFLNATAATDSQNLFDEKMMTDLASACVTRAGAPGTYRYANQAGGSETAAVTFISAEDAAQYCRWKNTSSSTSTPNFNCCANGIDQKLKSNQVQFQLINTSTTNAPAQLSSTGNNGSWEKDLEEVGLLFAIVAGSESSGILNTDDEDHLNVEGNSIHEEESSSAYDQSAIHETVTALELEVTEATATAYHARNQAGGGSDVLLWNEAIEKAGEAAIAHESLIEIYQFAHDEAAIEQQASWVRKMEEAENERKHWAANVIRYEATKVFRNTVLELTPKMQLDLKEGTALWDEVISKNRAIENCFHKVIIINQKGLQTAPEWARASWINKIDAQIKERALWALPLAKSRALETKRNANVALAQVLKVDHRESGPLWDEAIEKAEEAEHAYTEFYQASNKSLAATPEQMTSQVMKRIAELENTANSWGLKVLWRKARKQESVAIVLSQEAKIQSYTPEIAVSFWEQTIEEGVDAEQAYDQAIEFCKMKRDQALENFKALWTDDLKALGKSKAIWSENILWYIGYMKQSAGEVPYLKKIASRYDSYRMDVVSFLSHTSGSNAIRIDGGLSNEGDDCFINSALQFYRELHFLPPSEIEMPHLSKLLANEPRTNQDDRQLRLEMANKVMAGHQEFRHVVDNINSYSNRSAFVQQDASTFLRLLLEKTLVPSALFKTKLTNQTTGEIRLGQSKTSIFPLTLPSPQEIRGVLSMQELVDKSLICTAEGYDWIEKDKDTRTTITKESTLSNPVPASLLVSLGRFDSSGAKRKDIIQGIFDNIAFPGENGEPIFYQANAIICHLGDSINEGHYICYRKDGNQWVKFNDDKVTPITKFEVEDYENILQNSYLISFVRSNSSSK